MNAAFAANVERWYGLITELKPCPFCGGKAFFDKMYSPDGDWEYCIACADCECMFTVEYRNPDKNYLLNAWNRRAEDETD